MRMNVLLRSLKKYLPLLIPFLITGFAWAGEKEDVFKNWALRPSAEGPAWILEQRVFLEGDDKTPLVHMAVQYLDTVGEKSASGLWVMLRVPLGVQLQLGLKFQIDQGEPVAIAFHHCRSTGCVALWPLNKELREKLVAGKEARVTFHTLKGESVGVPVSLMGIKAGMAALEKKRVGGGQ